MLSQNRSYFLELFLSLIKLSEVGFMAIKKNGTWHIQQARSIMIDALSEDKSTFL